MICVGCQSWRSGGWDCPSFSCRKKMLYTGRGVGDEFDCRFFLRKKRKVTGPSSRACRTVHRTVLFTWVRILNFLPPQKRPVRKNWSFLWWGRTDSNHRSDTQQIYSLSPLATRELPRIKFGSIGAGRRTRTPDLLITNQLLYQLSYTGGSNRTRLL